MFFVTRVIGIFYLAVASLFLSACVTPPSIPQPEDIAESVGGLAQAKSEIENIELLRKIKRARSFASAGRSLEAERLYLLVLRQSPENAAVANDLAIVLLGQERNREAYNYLAYAHSIRPEDSTTVENLAKVSYKIGEYDKSRLYYDKLIREVEKRNDWELQTSKLTSLYRDRSTASLAAGLTGEAVCDSEKALKLSPSLEELEQHSRLLLSTDSIEDAIDFLSRSARSPKFRDKSSSLTFDYALALLAKGRSDLSSRAFERLIASLGANDKEKLDAKFFNSVSLAFKESKETGRPLPRFKYFNSEFCDLNLERRRPYLPTTVVKKAGQFLERNCGAST